MYTVCIQYVYRMYTVFIFLPFNENMWLMKCYWRASEPLSNHENWDQIYIYIYKYVKSSKVE